MLGLLVGVSELVSRYRDEPVRAIASLSAFVYVVINVLAALAALYVTDVSGWRFGLAASASPGVVRMAQVLVSGSAAMALFRSALFNVRIGENDVGIGPNGILQVLLDAADRAVDRNRAGSRAVRVAEITDGVSFNRAHDVLPAFCFALLQNLPAATQEAAGNEIKALANSGISENGKVLIMGLTLMNVVGENVLTAAVKALASEIKQPKIP
jgi:hypothetical protein